MDRLVLTSLNLGGGLEIPLPKVEILPGDELVLSDGKGKVIQRITYAEIRAQITQSDTKVIGRPPS